MDLLIPPRRVHIPVSQGAKDWGMFVSRVGCSGSASGARGQGEGGRTLGEFAVVYLTRGGGTFYASPGSPRAVAAGDLMLLFPGVWHRYHSHPDTGWNEYWALFDGAWPRAVLKASIISPARPVLRPGMDNTLHELFIRLIDTAEARAPGHEWELAALCTHILARALSLSESRAGRGRRRLAVVEKAMMYLQEHRHRQVDLEELAASVHLSYPHFRRLFKRIAKTSPHQYHLQLRIARAKELLEQGALSVKEVAARLGFDDQYYFARLFKKKTGVAPSRWTPM